MRRNFSRYSLYDFIEKVLKPAVGKVKFSEVHIHATWKPTIAQFRKDGGLRLVQGMWRFHTGTQKWSDIAQHATIDPDGYIWDGRSLLQPPASSTNYNDGDNDHIHPFMFEMIGDFDKGKEKLEGPQLLASVGLTRAVVDLFGSKPRFHREMDTKGKTCPGSGIDMAWFMKLVEGAKPKMKVEDAEKLIKILQAVYGIVPDKEIGRLADELRVASGQKPQNR